LVKGELKVVEKKKKEAYQILKRGNSLTQGCGEEGALLH